MEELSISRFRELLAKQIKEFKDCCTVWENVLSTETVPEEVSDEIRVTIGLTNLLMQQKMKQFRELVDDSEHNRGEKEITCVDLQGFWDMVYNEVEKIQKSFKKLEKCQNNDWVFIEEPISKTEPKKKPGLTISAQVASTAKERAIAARQRLAEAKLKMKARLTKNNENTVEEHATSTAEKASIEHTDQLSMANKIEDAVNLNTPRKHAKSLKIENFQASERKEVSPSEDLKSVKVSASRKKNKENFLSVAEKNFPKTLLKTPNEKTSLDEPALHNKRRSPKEIIPLQCMTRSAKKALLAKENALKNNSIVSRKENIVQTSE